MGCHCTRTWFDSRTLFFVLNLIVTADDLRIDATFTIWPRKYAIPPLNSKIRDDSKELKICT